MATFGNTDVPTPLNSTSAPILNSIKGSWFACPETGIADSITSWLVSGALGRWAAKVKYAIYAYAGVGDAGGLVGVTDELLYFGGGLEVHPGVQRTASFSAPKPLLYNVNYYLVAWATITSGGVGLVRSNTLVANKHVRKDLAYDSYPNPMTGESAGNRRFFTYCTYTPAVFALKKPRQTATIGLPHII